MPSPSLVVLSAGGGSSLAMSSVVALPEPVVALPEPVVD